MFTFIVKYPLCFNNIARNVCAIENKTGLIFFDSNHSTVTATVDFIFSIRINTNAEKLLARRTEDWPGFVRRVFVKISRSPRVQTGDGR